MSHSCRHFGVRLLLIFGYSLNPPTNNARYIYYYLLLKLCREDNKCILVSIIKFHLIVMANNFSEKKERNCIRASVKEFRVEFPKKRYWEWYSCNIDSYSRCWNSWLGRSKSVDLNEWLNSWGVENILWYKKFTFRELINWSRICGKGVGLSLFPSDSLSFEWYEQFVRISKKSKNDCFFGHFWAQFGYVSQIPAIRI